MNLFNNFVTECVIHATKPGNHFKVTPPTYFIKKDLQAHICLGNHLLTDQCVFKDIFYEITLAPCAVLGGVRLVTAYEVYS